jgi:hypothetical protein
VSNQSRTFLRCHRTDRRQDAEARLEILRRRAGSPEDDLPSTSSTRDKGDTLLERHRKEKARQEKRERKTRERLDFDFPSESARREAGRETGKGGGRQNAREEDHGAGKDETWESGGHLNFFADLERNVNTSQLVGHRAHACEV